MRAGCHCERATAPRLAASPTTYRTRLVVARDHFTVICSLAHTVHLAVVVTIVAMVYTVVVVIVIDVSVERVVRVQVIVAFTLRLCVIVDKVVRRRIRPARLYTLRLLAGKDNCRGGAFATQRTRCVLLQLFMATTSPNDTSPLRGSTATVMRTHSISKTDKSQSRVECGGQSCRCRSNGKQATRSPVSGTRF
jgi:hypothetical protein